MWHREPLTVQSFCLCFFFFRYGQHKKGLHSEGPEGLFPYANVGNKAIVDTIYYLEQKTQYPTYVHMYITCK